MVIDGTKLNVYQAINQIQKELSSEGIGKSRTNTQPGTSYKFRGIDDIYNALAPLLAKYGLCILPRMLNRKCDERTSKSGAPLFFVNVDAEFDFVSASDGSMHVIKTFGEAMDTSDKATNKAMSAAYKYAAIQAFAIPTEGDNDADSHTHQPSADHRLKTKSPTLKTGDDFLHVQVRNRILTLVEGDEEMARQCLVEITKGAINEFNDLIGKDNFSKKILQILDEKDRKKTEKLEAIG